MVGAGVLVVPTVALADDEPEAPPVPPEAPVEEDVLQDQ